MVLDIHGLGFSPQLYSLTSCAAWDKATSSILKVTPSPVILCLSVYLELPKEDVDPKRGQIGLYKWSHPCTLPLHPRPL